MLVAAGPTKGLAKSATPPRLRLNVRVVLPDVPRTPRVVGPPRLCAERGTTLLFVTGARRVARLLLKTVSVERRPVTGDRVAREDVRGTTDDREVLERVSGATFERVPRDGVNVFGALPVRLNERVLVEKSLPRVDGVTDCRVVRLLLRGEVERVDRDVRGVVTGERDVRDDGERMVPDRDVDRRVLTGDRVVVRGLDELRRERVAERDEPARERDARDRDVDLGTALRERDALDRDARERDVRDRGADRADDRELRERDAERAE